MASNLVNEPITIVSSLAVGDLATAWHASERFAINSTVGFLGWYDRARGYGLAPVQSDIGLALCHYGVGEGGYLVLPLIGPRTVRDAVADVMIVNAILWTSLAAVLGTGASLETFLVAETIEIAADIVATRQMDPHAVALDGLDYEATRREYLRQRRQRCGDPVVAASEPAL
jgi:phospholipid-binding lipoprotein MlaA